MNCLLAISAWTRGMYRGVILLVCCFVTCLLLTKYSDIAFSGSGTEVRSGGGLAGMRGCEASAYESQELGGGQSPRFRRPWLQVAFYFICKIIHPISLRLRPMYAKYKRCAILNAPKKIKFSNLVRTYLPMA